jgi:DNA polymerase III epsilon subunit family exonuclease
MKTPVRARFLQLWVAMSLLCAGSIVLVLVALGAALPPAERATAIDLLSATGALPYLLALILVAAIGFLAAWLNSGYFIPLAALADATTLTALGNPAHRLQQQGPAELRRLIEAINSLAERHDQALRHIEARVGEFRGALEAERNRLAVLMTELPQGVVVCNAQGVVLLYNEQSRHLLCPPAGHAFLGLGRSLHALFGDGKLSDAMDELTQRDAAGEIDPVVELGLTVGTLPVRIRVAPVAGTADSAQGTSAPTGFVLVLEGGGNSRRSQPAGQPRTSPAARPVFYDFDLFHRSLPQTALEERALSELAYTVFDTETTGLDPSAGDEIVAIGAARIINGRLAPGDTFDCLVDPGRSVDPRSARVHGLTDALLRGQPTLAVVLPRFHAFCADTVLVGHNVAFDLRFLQLKERATGVHFRQPVLDTLLLAAVLDAHSEDDRLEAIAHRFGIEVLARHTALGDALITAEVFLKMLPLLAARGIANLRQARAASERTRYARIRY